MNAPEKCFSFTPKRFNPEKEPGFFTLPTLSRTDQQAMRQMVAMRRTVHKGTAVFHSGDRTNAIYFVASGFLKCSVLSEDGREQVTGFYVAGEFAGLDSVDGSQHRSTVVAQEDSEILVFPWDAVQQTCTRIPQLARFFDREISAEIVRGQSYLAMLGTFRAERRLAAFLLNLAARLTSDGSVSQQFNLRLTRKDIGSCVGLTLESVSRLLTRLHLTRILDVNRKSVRILDVTAMQTLATGVRRMQDFPADDESGESRPAPAWYEKLPTASVALHTVRADPAPERLAA